MNYQIDSKNVSWERVENEVIAIQLVTGRYYNILDSSCEIWSLLSNGHSIESIINFFESEFSFDDVSNDISSFLDDCKRSQLIINLTSEIDINKIESTTFLKSWSKPVLVEYTDLQDLILVDPIHDVEVSGWPDVNK